LQVETIRVKFRRSLSLFVLDLVFQMIENMSPHARGKKN